MSENSYETDGGTNPVVDNRFSRGFFRGLSAVYPRGDGRSSLLAADQWVDAYLSV